MPIDWPPDFFVLPMGIAVAKSEAKPCRCGAVDFLIVESKIGVSVQCPRCAKRKPDDRVLGVLDRTNWTIRKATRDETFAPRR